MNIASTGSQTAEMTYPATSSAAAQPLPVSTALPGATPADPSGGASKADPQAVDAAVKAANDAAQRAGSNVEFAKDDTNGQIVVRIIDSETQKVLRQMPSEEMIQLGKSIDSMRGTMIHLKA